MSRRMYILGQTGWKRMPDLARLEMTRTANRVHIMTELGSSNFFQRNIYKYIG